MHESAGPGPSLVHPQPWVHHCARAGDSACPVSVAGLSSDAMLGLGGGPLAVSPMGCTPWCIRPRLRRMIGQSPSPLAGSLWEALSERDGGALAEKLVDGAVVVAEKSAVTGEAGEGGK